MNITQGELISKSWELIKSDWAYFLIGYLLVMIISNSTGMILYGPLMVGFYAGAWKKLHGQQVGLEALFQDGFAKFLPAFLVSLVVAALTMAGSLACLVGALIVSIYCHFALMFVAIEDQVGVWEAVCKSANLVKGHFWFIFATSLIVVGLNILGLLACFMGIWVTAPLSMLMFLFIFKELLEQQAVETAPIDE